MEATRLMKDAGGAEEERTNESEREEGATKDVPEEIWTDPGLRVTSAGQTKRFLCVVDRRQSGRMGLRPVRLAMKRREPAIQDASREVLTEKIKMWIKQGVGPGATEWIHCFAREGKKAADTLAGWWLTAERTMMYVSRGLRREPLICFNGDGILNGGVGCSLTGTPGIWWPWGMRR